MAYIGTPPANRPLTSFDIGENNITSFNISEAVIETLDIVNGSVTADKLAANAVTTSTISDNTITTAKLASNFAWGHGHALSALSGNVSVEQLPNVGITAGTYGNATSIPAVTVNSKGQVTAVSNVSISSAKTLRLDAYTANATWTVPDGVTEIVCEVIGGGGGCGISGTAAGGGGLAYGNVAVTAGQVLTIAVGQGGLGGQPMGQNGLVGGTSSIIRSGTTLLSATGGAGAGTGPGSGGSGSGGSIYNVTGGTGGSATNGNGIPGQSPKGFPFGTAFQNGPGAGGYGAGNVSGTSGNPGLITIQYVV